MRDPVGRPTAGRRARSSTASGPGHRDRGAQARQVERLRRGVQGDRVGDLASSWARTGCRRASTSGAWISSATTRTPCRAASSPTARSSSAVCSVPVGLCGWHSRYAARRPVRGGLAERPVEGRPGRAGRRRRAGACTSRRSGVLDERGERRVHRRVDDDRVARVGEQPQHLDDAQHHVGDQPRAPRRRPSQSHRSAANAAIASAYALPDGYPVSPQAHRVGDGPDHRLGLRHVHLRDEQRQHVRRVVPPLLAGPSPQLVEGHGVEDRHPTDPRTRGPDACGRPARARQPRACGVRGCRVERQRVARTFRVASRMCSSDGATSS